MCVLWFPALLFLIYYITVLNQKNLANTNIVPQTTRKMGIGVLKPLNSQNGVLCYLFMFAITCPDVLWSQTFGLYILCHLICVLWVQVNHII